MRILRNDRCENIGHLNLSKSNGLEAPTLVGLQEQHQISPTLLGLQEQHQILLVTSDGEKKSHSKIWCNVMEMVQKKSV